MPMESNPGHATKKSYRVSTSSLVVFVKLEVECAELGREVHIQFPRRVRQTSSETLSVCGDVINTKRINFMQKAGTKTLSQRAKVFTQILLGLQPSLWLEFATVGDKDSVS